MDPNAALTRIRDLIGEADALNPHVCFDHNEVARILYALTEVVEGLDDWITDGGFLPEDWRPTAATTRDTVIGRAI
ncbi:hypothetical protein OHB26_03205 [Nocardia sp. NBC_01503]|uniref:hypothetical protein n=1 Tax=Nocardia sp. NBC_01503 TaxID=2975997 RepID=UPI002E7ADEAB|nr:hypothetical protein [Nocardia sp. NBC_01503]WTL33272.1 hypothetical protein OHB26_03205 [Nocardia sp. NBC_01503]